MLTKVKNVASVYGSQSDIMTNFVRATNLHLKLSASKQKHMNLLQISDDCQYYLFIDNQNSTLTVYSLDLSNRKDSFHEFKKYYDVPWEKS